MHGASVRIDSLLTFICASAQGLLVRIPFRPLDFREPYSCSEIYGWLNVMACQPKLDGDDLLIFIDSGR